MRAQGEQHNNDSEADRDLHLARYCTPPRNSVMCDAFTAVEPAVIVSAKLTAENDIAVRAALSAVRSSLMCTAFTVVTPGEIGRASCRERVELEGGGGAVKTKEREATGDA